MRKTYPMMILMCAAVAAGGAGCAQPSVKGPTVTVVVIGATSGCIERFARGQPFGAGFTAEIEGGKALILPS